ncbi:hypothetical protein C5167_028912 [Papaver somniferum]|nr:hypothetical protein C5167_028912 [Papaver somniferum]
MGVSKVTLCAPNLSSFICFTSLVEDYRLENLSSLVTADVRINIKQYDKISKIELHEKKKVSHAQRMVKLLGGIHNVKVLSLTNDFKVLAGAPEALDCQLPEFPNLQRLILKTWLSRGCIDAIIHLLKESPNLEFLELNIEPVILGAKHIWNSGASLPFKLHHLKHIVIRGLQGYGNNEVRFIKIMLKNAMALEKVVLFGKFSQEDSRTKKRTKNFKATLLAYPGASSIISFRVDPK